MKNRKTIIVAFMLIAVLLLGVGYAALTDQLTIIGNAHIDMGAAGSNFDQKVYFSDAQAVSSTGEGTTADAVSFNADDATFTANKLAKLGDKSVFNFTITNDSNVAVDITVADTKLSGAANPSNSNAGKFKVTYEFKDSISQITANGGTVQVIVTVEVIAPITDATSATFGIEYTATTVDATNP